MHTDLYLENLKAKDNLEDLAIDGWLILKPISKKQGVRM